MRRRFARGILWVPAIVFVSVAIYSPAATAQSAARSSPVANPYLLLIRDRVVQSELGITDVQQRAITRVTDELDQPFLALRGQRPPEADQALERLIATAKVKIKVILTAEQQTRLSEVILRVQGIRAQLLPEVSGTLALSDGQRSEIQTVIRDTDKALITARAEAQKEETAAELERQVARIREEEQIKILRTLDQAQRGRWLSLLGRDFDISRLGQMSFKAPELSKSAVWINSPALEMASLEGKVVALHFWTFG